MCNRPADGVEEKKPAGGEQQRPAVFLNLFLGGGEDRPIREIEGQARGVGAAVPFGGGSGGGDHGTRFRAVGCGIGTRFQASLRVCTRNRSGLAGRSCFYATDGRSKYRAFASTPRPRAASLREIDKSMARI